MRYEPPRGWASLPLKRFLSGNDSGTWGDDPTGHGDTLVLRSTEQTADGRWCISDPAPRSLDPKERIRTRLRKGDLIITKSSGSPTHIGKTTLVEGPLAEAGYAFGNFMQRLRTRRALVPKFLWYVMQADMVRQQIPLVSTTTTGLANLNGTVLGSLVVLVPPHEEQSAIVDFLDRETAKIDALIEKQHALVSLLSERLDRVWAQTYLGLRAPEVAVRHVVESVIDGPFGSSLTSAHYADEGVRVIRLGNIGVNVFRDTDQAFVSQAYGQQLAAHGARPGDVVMAGLGDERMPLGRAAVVPEDLGPAIVKADCYRLRPGRRVSAGYLAWALSSPPVRSQIADLSRGATRSRLNTGLAKGVRIAVPSASEQARVERQWAAESTRHLALILKAEEFIGLAKERRAALITAAVTGQIEVLRKAS